MCGIIGYIGKERAEDIMLDGLGLLEYRGYDSVGIAFSHEDNISVIKCKGRVNNLREKCEDIRKSGSGDIFGSTCAIGHTRWATHGNVSDKNAHPHQVGMVTLVHNGIIENYNELIDEFHLRDELQSDTDTEVAAALLNLYYHMEDDPRKAIIKTIKKIRGTFAFVIMFKDKPGKIFCVRNVSPIVATHVDGASMLASDVTALCRFTNSYFIIPENAITTLTRDEILIEDFEGNSITPEYQVMDWDKNASDKGGYPFYMEKEIMEQPKAIAETIEKRVKDDLPDFSCDNVPDELFEKFDNICIIACGTAMHSGLVFQSLAIDKLRIPVDVWMASEFIYSNPIITDKTLVIAISQSGETIDTLEALKYAKNVGGTVLSILNVRGSAIAHASDYVLYTDAGPEIAVASTKAYTTQLAMLYLLIAKIAQVRKISTEEAIKDYIKELKRVPNIIEKIFEMKHDIHLIAGRIINAENLFMIGRGLDYAILREGCLKLKEVSYIHSEAYAAGELKHGPIALITEQTPVIASMTQDALFLKELSNIREVASRGASVVVLAKESYKGEIKEDYGIIYLPTAKNEFMTFSSSVVLQLIAYYVSSDKGFDVDKPRNLAKVVTVE